MRRMSWCVVMLFWVMGNVHVTLARDMFWYTPMHVEGMIKDDIAKMYPYIYTRMFMDGQPILIKDVSSVTRAGYALRARVYEIEMVGGKGSESGNYDLVLYYVMGYDGVRTAQYYRMYCASVGDPQGMKNLREHRDVFLQWAEKSMYADRVVAALAGAKDVVLDVDLPSPHALEKANLMGISVDYVQDSFAILMYAVEHARSLKKDGSIPAIDVTAKNYVATKGKTLEEVDASDPAIRGLEQSAYVAFAKHLLDNMRNPSDHESRYPRAKHVRAFLMHAGRTLADVGTSEKELDLLDRNIVARSIADGELTEIVRTQVRPAAPEQALRDMHDPQRDLLQNYMQLARGTKDFWNVQPFVDYVQKHLAMHGNAISVSENELRDIVRSGYKAQLLHETNILVEHNFIGLIDDRLLKMEHSALPLGKTLASVIGTSALQKKLAKMSVEDAQSTVIGMQSEYHMEGVLYDDQRIRRDLARAKKTFAQAKISEKDYTDLFTKKCRAEVRRAFEEAQREKRFRSVSANIAVMDACASRIGETYDAMGISSNAVRDLMQ